MKNLHLVPANVIDLVNKLDDTTVRENEKNNYILRLEAIRDYTTTCLNTHHRDKNSMTNKSPLVRKNSILR
jgi:hypothetical protein